MIREYNKNDIDVIIKLFTLHHELSEIEEKEIREQLAAGGNVLVYEDNSTILGMCSIIFLEKRESGSHARIIMSVDEDAEFEKVANGLWEAIQDPLKEKGVTFLWTYYSDMNIQWREFYAQKQLEYWFGIHYMVYNGGKFAETNLTFRKYEESDFTNYYTYIGKCFRPMREANDIKPYDIFKGASPEKIEKMKKNTMKLKDSIYLFYEGEQFVGSSIIKSEEIDDLFVVPEYQGKGYGRKMMEATINLALEKNLNQIKLGVVAWNKVAINLYESLGFEEYLSYEYRRLISS